MNVWQLYNKDNNEASDYIGMDSYIGRKVRHIIYEGDQEKWSETIHTITNFDDDICGSGCCHGFTISDSDVSWGASQLEVVDE